MPGPRITAKGRYLPAAHVDVKPQPIGCLLRIDDKRHADVWVEVWIPVELLREMLLHVEQCAELHNLIDDVWSGNLPEGGSGEDPVPA